MHKFDSYIDIILKGVNASEIQKSEMAEEFRDHLEYLKQENLDSGMGEVEAETKAMEVFGDHKVLSRTLRRSLVSYRTKYNIIAGLLYIVFAIAVYKIGRTLPFNEINIHKPLGFVEVEAISAILDILILGTIAYFLPIIFTKVRTVVQLFIINLVLIISVIFISIIAFNESLDILLKNGFDDFVVIVACLCIAYFSSHLGYKLLNKVNDITLEYI
jgi:hypothetical protein